MLSCLSGVRGLAAGRLLVMPGYGTTIAVSFRLNDPWILPAWLATVAAYKCV